MAFVHHALGFEVMDRSHLKAIFAEHRMALGGLMNEESLIELGRLESVDVIVTGTIARLSDRYKITVKAHDTETASLLAADRAYCARTLDLDAAFSGLSHGLTPRTRPQTGAQGGLRLLQNRETSRGQPRRSHRDPESTR